jgi:GTP-binding protein HflX
LIRNRIGRLKDELKKVQNSRKIQREKRRSIPVPQAILVGYTNSGKSTLFNQLTEAGVLAADKLFATLDPTTRRIELPGHFEVLLTDSVGFIRKLPTELVEAFKATLEEVQNAELLVHVIDASDPLWESQKRATEKVLEELDCLHKPMLEVYNKIDRLPQNEFGIAQSPRRVFVSALQALHLDKLKEKIAEILGHGREKVRLVLPQGRGDLLAIAYREGNILEQAYESDRMELTVELPKKRIDQWKREGFVVFDS